MASDIKRKILKRKTKALKYSAALLVPFGFLVYAVWFRPENFRFINTLFREKIFVLMLFFTDVLVFFISLCRMWYDKFRIRSLSEKAETASGKSIDELLEAPDFALNDSFFSADGLFLNYTSYKMHSVKELESITHKEVRRRRKMQSSFYITIHTSKGDDQFYVGTSRTEHDKIFNNLRAFVFTNDMKAGNGYVNYGEEYEKYLENKEKLNDSSGWL